jgi:hypothetical protein
MKTALRLVSYLGLALSVVPGFFVMAGSLSMPAYYKIINVGMVLWFATAVFWIKAEKTEG